LLLTLIDSDKLDKATKTMVVMVATLFGGAGALSLIKTSDAIKASIAIIGLSTALAIASFALKNVSDLDEDEIKNGLLAMAAGLTALVISVNAISSGTGPGLIKTVGILTGLGVALLVLSAAIKVFGLMDPDVLSQGLSAIAVSLALLVASMSILSTGKGKSTLKASAAIIGMSFALDKLATAVTKFGEMDIDILTQGLKSTGIVLAGFAAFSRLVRPAGMIAAAIAIGIMSVALLVMAAAVESFADITWKELIRGLTGMALALLILVVAAVAMTGAIGGALATIIMAGAILLLASALKVFATLSWAELILALVGLAAVFVILGLAGLILTPVMPTLLLLGLAMLLIGAGAALMGLGILAAATGLVALAGALALMAKGIVLLGVAFIETLPGLVIALVETLGNFVAALALKMPVIIKSVITIVLGMIEAVVTLIPEMVDAIFTMITAILARIAESMPDLVQAGWEILIAFMQGLSDHLPEMVETILVMLTAILARVSESMPSIVQSGWEILLAFIKGIADHIEEMVSQILAMVISILTEIARNIPDIIQAGYEILLAIIQGIGDNIAEVVAAALYVIAQFIEGIAQGLPDIVDSAFNLILTFLEAIEDSIEEYMPKIIAAGLSIGKAIVKGLVQGINKGIGAVKRAVLKLAKAAWNRLVSFFDAKSPSRLTYKLAGYVIKGFVNGIQDGIEEVVNGMEEFGRRAKESLDPMIQALVDDIDKGVEFRPVITPVLDLDEVTTGVKTLNKSFNNAKVLAALTYDGQLTVEGEESGLGVNGSDGRVTFIQNNYSPKALDRETIYRQTRTQVAKLSERAFE
jgi:AcrR family transcriptional regulator